jgi:RNA polymerase sigma-70 factor (ECF subfamily)
LLQKENKTAEFEEAVMPHLDAAYNLARWLARNDTDAEDIVQEAYLRAFKFFRGFHGMNGRAWMLQIVRNTYYSWVQKNKTGEQATEFDEEIHGATESGNPETALIEQVDRQELKRMLDDLPIEFREIIVLRDLEGFSYKEIANIADLPLGTVMSRLARARERLITRAAALQKGGTK